MNPGRRLHRTVNHVTRCSVTNSTPLLNNTYPQVFHRLWITNLCKALSLDRSLPDGNVWIILSIQCKGLVELILVKDRMRFFLDRKRGKGVLGGIRGEEGVSCQEGTTKLFLQ